MALPKKETLLFKLSNVCFGGYTAILRRKAHAFLYSKLRSNFRAKFYGFFQEYVQNIGVKL